MENRQCWLDTTAECSCEEDSKCELQRLRYAKIVFCNDRSCLYNHEMPYAHTPDRGKNYVPFEDDKMTGFCTRPGDLALAPHEISELKVKRRLTTCGLRSDRSLERPYFPDPDKIEGGSYPDPASADWSTSAFH
jgi:hypothetical protein